MFDSIDWDGIRPLTIPEIARLWDNGDDKYPGDNFSDEYTRAQKIALRLQQDFQHEKIKSCSVSVFPGDVSPNFTPEALREWAEKCGWHPAFLFEHKKVEKKKTDTAPKSRRGAPPYAHTEKLKAQCFELMTHHGDFCPEDEDWNVQARLEVSLMDFCSRESIKPPSITWLRDKLPDWVSQWRECK